MEYDWKAVYDDLAFSRGTRVFLMLDRYGDSFILGVEAELVGLGDCLEPQVFYVASCREEEPVDEEILGVASVADRIEYTRGCFYIVFNLRSTSEFERVYDIVSTRLGIKVRNDIQGHWVVKDE